MPMEVTQTVGEEPKTDELVDDADSDDDATKLDGAHRPVLATPQDNGDDRHFWKDCSECDKTRLWKVQCCSCSPHADFTRRGKYQQLTEVEFYDEEAKRANDEIQLEITRADGINERSLEAARRLAESKMPKGHNEQLAWYHVRMMSRQIMKVVDPDRLWEFEASDYDLQTFRRILKGYGGSYNDQYWDKVDDCPCAKNINEYIFKVRTNIDIAGVGDSGAKLHGKSKKGSIAYDLWEQKEFEHDKPNVKIPSLRGNVEWHMLSGASLKDLIEQCEKMYAKRFGGDQSMLWTLRCRHCSGVRKRNVSQQR